MPRVYWVLVLGLTWSARVHAEPPPVKPLPPAPAAPSAPPSPQAPPPPAEAEAPSGEAEPPAAPDLLVLKNGNRFRGTIAELVKGEYVTIVLITGETRKIAWDEVEHAGPVDEKPARRARDHEDHADDADAEEESAAAVEPKRPLRHTRNMDASPASYDILFSSDKKGTRFFVRGESERGYRFVCTAPCSDWLEPQAYAVAIRVGDEEMIHANTVAIDGPTRVLANYRDRSGVRSTGFLVLALSTVTLGLTYFYSQDEQAATPLVVSAAASGIVGVCVGIGLTAASDGVVIRTSPLRQ